MVRVLVGFAGATVLALTLSGALQAGQVSPTPGALQPTGSYVDQRTTSDGTSMARSSPPLPLHGKVIVIDPGHQLGNSGHPDQVNRLVDAGGFQKACNTTGTSTNGGFPESTFAWRISRVLKAQLEDRGARVHLTRRTNSVDEWGPCIDVRGRSGNRFDADAVVSVHGDGASSGVRGFFVIRPGYRRGWTGDITRPSKQFASDLRHGLSSAGAVVSNSYGNDGYDVRTDLGTLNWSDVPIVMVELGNMRNSTDAHHMTTPRYRKDVYVAGLRKGLVTFLR